MEDPDGCDYKSGPPLPYFKQNGSNEPMKKRRIKRQSYRRAREGEMMFSSSIPSAGEFNTVTINRSCLYYPWFIVSLPVSLKLTPVPRLIPFLPHLVCWRPLSGRARLKAAVGEELEIRNERKWRMRGILLQTFIIKTQANLMYVQQMNWWTHLAYLPFILLHTHTYKTQDVEKFFLTHLHLHRWK